MERPRRIILRLAEGTTSIPKLAREFGITKSAVYPIAERAVRDGFLDRLPGIWPNTYRPGPNLLLTTASLTQMAPMRHRALSLEIGPSRTFRLRAHALQASVPVLALDGADLSAWTACKPNPVGRMHKVSTGGLRMQLRGRTLLVVSVPALTLAATEDTIQEAARRIKEHVSKYVILARKTAREKYHIQAGSPARWYRKPHVAIERFPGVPEGVAYTVSFWVDSSLGPAEVESANLETIESLMAVGNRISRDLSMSTFA